MAADYDAPRVNDQEEPADIIPGRPAVDVLEVDGDENGIIDISIDDTISEAVIIPLQASEFVCRECFLVISRLRLARGAGSNAICQDCAA